MLNQDFKDFVQSLNDNGVRYLIVGNYAFVLHGHPRFIDHFDVWIERTSVNVESVLRALAQYGCGPLALTQDDYLLPDGIIQRLGYPPSRIDLINHLRGVNFAECYSHRIEVEMEGGQVMCINLDDLRANEKASGRHQDSAYWEYLD